MIYKLTADKRDKIIPSLNLLHARCMDMEWLLLLAQSVTFQHNTGLTLWVKLSMREWWVGGSSSVTDAKWEYGISSNINLQYYVIGWQLALYSICYSFMHNYVHGIAPHSNHMNRKPVHCMWIECDVHRPCKIWTEATFCWFRCS